MCRSHKIYILLLVITTGLGIFAVLRYCKPQAKFIVKPEVLDVTDSQVTIAWLSEKPYKGLVLYNLAGSSELSLSATDSFAASKEHEVVIIGLSPSTRYTYSIAGSDNRFQFQTQPLPNTPFSFAIVSNKKPEQIVSLVMSEMPEFIVCLNSTSNSVTDPFFGVRPYLPIYNTTGVDSPFLRAVGNVESPRSWKLDWGGLRLVFVDKAEGLAKVPRMLNTLRPHTFGIITSGQVINEEIIRQTELHSIIVSHNKVNPIRPVAFVGIVGQRKQAVEIDQVQYFGIDAKSNEIEKGKNAGIIRVDVDVESIRAVFINENREIVLRKAPLGEKRTCEECRRLADKGAYEESIKAYEAFIKNNRGHFQIDDAYFAIAEILDEKLFRFAEALNWYSRLIDEYPGGTLTPLAKQRIKYLTSYSDYDYEPLARFERIKKVEFGRRKHIAESRDRILKEVELIIKEYPDSKLAPVMQYWLANQYRTIDPDKAVYFYMALKNKYAGHNLTKELMIDIGKTYYDAKRYKEARNTYNKALAELPWLRDTIKAQISRCSRNIHRARITLVCWCVLATTLSLVISYKPFGIYKDKLVSSFVAFVILSSVLLFGAWLIREQFSSVKEMFSIVISFSTVASVGSLISMCLGKKLIISSGREFCSVGLGGVIGILFFIAGTYLAIYYINVHYLIVIGM